MCSTKKPLVELNELRTSYIRERGFNLELTVFVTFIPMLKQMKRKSYKLFQIIRIKKEDLWGPHNSNMKVLGTLNQNELI